jgi:Protein of unknown function (DUF2569)
MQKKPFTGWLSLLIIILGPITLSRAGEDFEPLFGDHQQLLANYPSLPLALVVYGILMGASYYVSFYTAWVLYRRRPGTLGIARVGLVTRAILGLAANISLPMILGFPAEANYDRLIITDVFLILLTGVWYLYLKRSKKVMEIYAA